MKKLWTLSVILLAWALLAGCWNKEEVTIEEEVIENDYHPVLVARTAQDLELEDIDELNTLSSAFLWNVEIEQLDWTNVVLIKAWNELTEDAINETIETLEENDKITGVVRVVNDEYEEFFSSYDNWALREMWIYVNGAKEGLWSTYDEEGKVTNVKEYDQGRLLQETNNQEEDDIIDVELPEWAKLSLTNEELDDLAETNFPKGYSYSTYDIEKDEAWDEGKTDYSEGISHSLLIPEHAAMVSREVLSSAIEDGMIYTDTEATLKDGSKVEILYIVDPVTLHFVAATVEKPTKSINYQFFY